MAQLGTLTAGVAHELNNPAAAVKRGVSQLQNALTDYGRAQIALAGLSMTSEQQAALQAIEARIQADAIEPPTLSAIARSDAEYELEEWLEDRSVENGWDLAPTLVDLDYGPDQLSELARDLAPNQLPAVITWLSATNTVYSLMNEINLGAGRISEIVKSLKTYSYLDQAPVQEVDVHEGLDSTLVILRSKLKVGITVRRDYAEALPRITAYGSELNQVWTNIIDNAADALGGNGNIVIRTRQENADWVVVEIEDDGPGIPAEHLTKLFDPFFTTKAPGKGTGLGLNISYNIIVQKHRGEIKVFSRPGQTLFQVWLPVSFDSVQGGPPTLDRAQHNADVKLRRILEAAKTIAVVGITDRIDRPAHSVPAFLQTQGYRIIPVNPRLIERGITDILGEMVYPDLTSIPVPIDIVQIFRRGEETPPIIEEAIATGAKVVWMQLGIINEQAGHHAEAAGLDVVMDTCMFATHKRLLST